MPYSKESALARRTAFWDNSTYRIHQFINDVEVELASKWLQPEDEAAMQLVISLLHDIELAATIRYRYVLSQRIDFANSRKKQEASHD